MLSMQGFRSAPLAVCGALLLASPALAQRRTSPAYTGTEDLTDVRPFHSWYTDSVITQGVDLEPFLYFMNSELNGVAAGARTAVWTVERLELGAELGYLDIQDGESGLSDLLLYGRNQFDMGETFPDITVGAMVDLPTGDDALGEGTVDFTVFGAFRQSLVQGWTIHGNIGLESIEVGEDRESGLIVGGGVIVPITGSMAALGELNIGNNDYAAIDFGVDYELPPGNHVRLGVSLGLDDGAPDALLQIAMAIPVF